MKATTTEELLKIIVNAIQDKKGEDIRVVDIRHIDGAIANYFVICPRWLARASGGHSAIGGRQMPRDGRRAVGVNGLGTDQWVAIDFVDIIVHIFLPEPREFYDLEHLWEDANISIIKEGESL